MIHLFQMENHPVNAYLESGPHTLDTKMIHLFQMENHPVNAYLESGPHTFDTK